MTINDEHHGVDAWIFLSIADAYGRESEYSDPLATVMSNADWRNRGVPSVVEFQHAVRDLTGGGLIRASGVRFELTPSGEALWKRIQEQGAKAHPQFVYAREQMETVPCVASLGGWSIDQSRWEDAFATYSPQFALDLKRRKDIANAGSRLPADLQERVLVALRSPQRVAFLLTLAYSIGFSARGSYGSSLGEPSAEEALRAHNELVIVVLAQLTRTLKDPMAGSPDENFVTVLAEDGRPVMDSLIWAVSRALTLAAEPDG